MTIVEQVQDWYRDNVERVEPEVKSAIRSNLVDPVRGSVTIELETPSVLGTITFWNTGMVAVLGLHKETKKDFILDDRKLNPEENLPALLDRYVHQILEQN